MEILDKDVLFNIATTLDLDDLLSLCKSSRKINNLICQRNEIWNYKLSREFPDLRGRFPNIPSRKLYIMASKQNENLTRAFENTSKRSNTKIEGFQKIWYAFVSRKIREHNEIITNGFQVGRDIENPNLYNGLAESINKILKSGDFLYEDLPK